jgi:hypothetical protein
MEQLRRSLVLAPPDGPATALSNGEAAEIVGRVIALEALRTAVIELLRTNSPVPRANAQLRRLCSDLAKVVARAPSQQP